MIAKVRTTPQNGSAGATTDDVTVTEDVVRTDEAQRNIREHRSSAAMRGHRDVSRTRVEEGRAPGLEHFEHARRCHRHRRFLRRSFAMAVYETASPAPEVG
mmetsp:Transcript_8904/g.36783  ORF Transcript_8904/g.36783 Transcript_8904/m.36783 type:complete len:101 (+) Transcript_8904:304-606(+)